MKGGKGFEKFIDESLGFLNITWVRIAIIIIIILYIAGVIPMFTEEVASIFHNPLVKILFILLIIYIGFKDIPIALLLALAFVISLQMGYRYQLGVSVGPGVTAGVKAGIAENAEAGTPEVEQMVGHDKGDTPDGYNYNHYFDCVKECAENDLGKDGLDSPCTGVGVWKDEINAQGLNCPLGFSGEKTGSPF